MLLAAGHKDLNYNYFRAEPKVSNSWYLPTKAQTKLPTSALLWCIVCVFKAIQLWYTGMKKLEFMNGFVLMSFAFFFLKGKGFSSKKIKAVRTTGKVSTALINYLRINPGNIL